jgi:hypothetical protein
VVSLSHAFEGLPFSPVSLDLGRVLINPPVPLRAKAALADIGADHRDSRLKIANAGLATAAKLKVVLT